MLQTDGQMQSLRVTPESLRADVQVLAMKGPGK